MDRYIYVQSDESDGYFSDNRTYKFKVHLNTPLTLHGFWKVALLEFQAREKVKTKAAESLYVYTDICKESIVHGEEKALLRRMEKNKKSEWDYIFDTPFYLPVKKKDLREFELYIKTADGTFPSYLTKPLNLTLHLKQYPFFSEYGSL